MRQRTENKHAAQLASGAENGSISIYVRFCFCAKLLRALLIAKVAVACAMIKKDQKCKGGASLAPRMLGCGLFMTAYVARAVPSATLRCSTYEC